MALLFFEGFETVSNTTGAGTASALVTYCESLGFAGELTQASGARLAVAQDTVHTALKWGAASGANANYLRIPLKTPVAINSTLFIGARVRLTDQAQVSEIFQVWDSDGSLVLRLRHDGGQTFTVYRGNSSIATTGNVVSLGNWYYIELKWKLASSPNGAYDLRIDGVSASSNSATNTLDSFAGNMAFVHFGAPNGGTNDSNQAYIDDIYICDDSGSLNNTFLGAQIVRGFTPDAEGALNQWTPSTGTNNAALVDDLPLDTADYVESSTTGHDDLYSFQSVGATGIKGVRISGILGLSGLSTIKSFHLQAVSNSVTADSAIMTLSSVDTAKPQGGWHVFQADPNTTALWTAANINLAEFGLELD